ncbi:MAG: tetratricopeptide repeat protein [Verrucomicrobiales bacterium]|nr:tetratricopeptide repeat protein [Verrucomicrobiales bacterium]
MMRNIKMKQASIFQVLAKRFAAGVAILLLTGGGANQALAQDGDDSLEGLYLAAAEKAQAGDFKGALPIFEEAIKIYGSVGMEDFGAGFGGVYFDYGATLLQLFRWEEARDAFRTCVESYPNPKPGEKAQSKVPSVNKREKLALFQWGYCEQMMKNPAEALKLYQRYLDSKPDPKELATVRNVFSLRRGGALVGVGRIDEGEAELRKLFENQAKWKVAPQFLMQALLELSLGWIDQSSKLGKDITNRKAHDFLNKYSSLLTVQPFDQARFGFGQRLKKLGFESSQAGLHTLALRYYSMIPTADDILADVKMRALSLPPGSRVPAVYAATIKKYEDELKKPDQSDMELMRLVAASYEKLGNRIASRAIYTYLAENYLKSKARPEILHEAARFSTLIGDYSSAQYYGDQFMKEFPDHRLENNVATFMLQSLFTAREYGTVMEVCEKVRKKYEPGDPARELADHLYGAALYFLGNHVEAQEPLDLFADKYPDSGNREAALYYQASNYVITGNLQKAAGLLDVYFQEFPQSKFLDLALFDRATCHFNLEEYDKSIAAIDRLREERKDSVVLDRALNMGGDAYDVKSGLETEDEAKKLELTEKALEYFSAAIDEGKKRNRKESVAEALARSADLSVQLERWEDGVKYYDAFFPDYEGTYWEPQISVFTLEALEKAGRAEDGLKQLEKMINFMGNQEPHEQDIELLRQAIGSYSEASVRTRGPEKTAANFDDFPGVNKKNQALLTWLKIQKVIVLQGMRGKVKKETPEYAKLEQEIAAVFKEMEDYEMSNLSEFALQQIGIYLSKQEVSATRFRAIPYFEELLVRPDADSFKAPADFEIGSIEMRSTQADKLSSARERFLRVINQYQEKSLIPESYLNLGRLAIKTQDWEEAKERFGKINKNKKWLDRMARAESNFYYGLALENLGRTDDAIKVYNAVIAVYGSYIDWSSQSLERGFNLAYNIDDPDKKIKAYKYLRKLLYMFAQQKEEDAPSGALGRIRRRLPAVQNELSLTPEQLTQIDLELGIVDEPEVKGKAGAK